MKDYLVKYFPVHKLRIELFFGAGGSYFYLPQPKYAILNDLDDDVTNLYLVVQNDPKALERAISVMPISESLIRYWKINTESDPIKRAVRFLLLSNFTYMGKGDTIRAGLDNAKKTLINNIEPTFIRLQNAKILNKDFREVLPSISFSKGLNDKDQCFCYMDPIYEETEHYYKVPKWSRQDTNDCFDIMKSSGIRCAMSEFDSQFLRRRAKELSLHYHVLKERANIKNRRIEVLITNYEDSQYRIDF